MQRQVVRPSLSLLKNLQRHYVTTELSHNQRYNILFPENSVKTVKAVKQFVRPLAKEKKFEYTVKAEKDQGHRVTLSIYGIRSDDLLDVQSDMLSKVFSKLGENVISTAESIDIEERDPADFDNINENPSAGMIYKDIVAYPQCAIPRRTIVDKPHWRLRNPFRLGIN